MYITCHNLLRLNRDRFLTTSPSSNSLSISKEMLLRTLSYHQVSVQYLDMLSSTMQFSEQSHNGNGSFWAYRSLGSPIAGLEAPDIGRSGHHYEIAFSLQGVESGGPTRSNQQHEWLLRSATIYHKFDNVHGSSLWLLSKTANDLHSRFHGEYAERNKRNDELDVDPVGCFTANLGNHLLLARWASESWAKYLSYLKNMITTDVSATRTRISLQH